MTRIVPIDFATACSMVTAWHRHHRPPIGHEFSIGLASADFDTEDGAPLLVGAIIVGRPVARHLDDGHTLEVTRSVVSDDVPNGNSQLYGAAWRAAKALGYRRLITYTQEGESGASLRGVRGNIELYFIDGDDLDTRSDLLWTVNRFKESRCEPLEAGELWRVTIPGEGEIVAFALHSSDGAVRLFRRAGNSYEGMIDLTLPRARLSTAEGEYVG